MIIRVCFITVLVALFGFGQARAEDAASGQPILRIEAGMHTARITAIASNRAGTLIATSSEDKTVRVWERSTGKLLQTLRVPIGEGQVGTLYAVAMSPDGQYVVCGGSTSAEGEPERIYLFDALSGKLITSRGELPSYVSALAWSADGQRIAVALQGGWGIRLLRADTLTPISQDTRYRDTATGVVFSEDGQVVSSDGDSIFLYNSVLKKRRKVKGDTGITALALSPDGNRLVVGPDFPEIRVLSARDLLLLDTPNVGNQWPNKFTAVAWSSDGKFLFAGGDRDPNDTFYVGDDEAEAAATYDYSAPTFGENLLRWDTSDFSKSPLVIRTGNSPLTGLTPLPNGAMAWSANDPAWGLVDTSGKATILGHSPISDFRGADDSFRLSADGHVVQFGASAMGTSLMLFDVRSALLSAQLADGNELLSPVTEGDIVVENWWHSSNTSHPSKLLALEIGDVSHALAFGPDRRSFLLGTTKSVQLYDKEGDLRWSQPTAGAAWAVNYSKDGRLVIAALGDGTLVWFRADTGARLLTLFVHSDQERWVAWTPSGYYEASPGGSELIGWHVNRGAVQTPDFFPASRFSAQYRRPDIVSTILSTLDEAEAIEQANAALQKTTGLISPTVPPDIKTLLPPVVSIVSPVPNAFIEGETVRLVVAMRALSGQKVERKDWLLMVDGAQVPMEQLPESPLTEEETQRAKVALSGDYSVSELTVLQVPVPPRDASIVFMAKGQYGYSVPAVTRIQRTGYEPASATGRRPNLYVLAIGVSKYQQASLSLEYAAKDSDDFVAELKQQAGRLYEKVEVNQITDQKATRVGVLLGLDWLKKKTTQYDVAMIFVAGHGVNDEAMQYYFLPHDAQMDQPYDISMVPDIAFQKALQQTAGKRLLFIDTCHSGNVMTAKTRGVVASKRPEADRFADELRKAENGVVVFAASRGDQLSRESSQWKNGAFTHVLLSGLDGEADGNKSGRVTVKMLDLWLSEGVRTLTGGTQSTVTYKPDGFTDFPVVIPARP